MVLHEALLLLRKVAFGAALFAPLEGLLSAAPLAAQAGRPYRAEDVRYQNGAVPLGAELILPRKDGRFPAAVIVQGSGTSDRRNAWARAVSEQSASGTTTWWSCRGLGTA
jgi:hypothetical protein